MNALLVLYGGNLSPQAFEEVLSPKSSPEGKKSALRLAMERGSSFPGVTKRVLLLPEGMAPHLPDLLNYSIIESPAWTKRSLLETLAPLGQGFECVYFAWADCPFLDPVLAGSLSKRHLKFAAEYSYADGWPYGFSPEILSPSTPGILAKLLGGDDGPVSRDALFTTIQRDINAFDIEAEIAMEDLRFHRLTLAADSKRNLLLCRGLMEAGLEEASEAAGIFSARPDILRTLPAFFAIQTAYSCPQKCAICPYPALRLPESRGEGDFMSPGRFESLLDNIISFAGDGVIDLSLWGEFALHPEKLELARMVLAREELSLIIETSGIGWKAEELEILKTLAEDRAGKVPRGIAGLSAPLSWIISLDALELEEYLQVRGAGFYEARETAEWLLRLFPENLYIQAVRMKGREDEIERFFRTWQERGAQVIIQKYDDFCGLLPAKQATDLSPVIRRPCWHSMRDMNILIDGTLVRCREDMAALKAALDPPSGERDGEEGIVGNVFRDSLETLWQAGGELYRDQCSNIYRGICKGCDEYYTFNF